MLTDTSFWIDILDERRNRVRGPAHSFLSRHRSDQLLISIVTWGELAEGFSDYEGLKTFLRGIKVAMLPLQVAWEGSRIQRELAQTGHRLGENDAWIAATAKTWGHRLVTRDRAFSRVRGLTVLVTDHVIRLACRKC